MKFGKRKKEYRSGDKRIKKFFAWYPVFIKGECRWLEIVTVEQEYYVDGWDGISGFYNIRFIE